MAVTRKLPDDLEDYFYYEDGILFWKIDRPRVKKGDRAGTIDTHGYLRTGLHGSKWFNHHILYFMYTGQAVDRLDHIDGNPLNNTKENLRPCCDRTNQYNRDKQRNNTSGYKGVSWHNVHKKYRAVCNGKHLGMFTCAKEASEAYERYARNNNGEFYRKAWR